MKEHTIYQWKRREIISSFLFTVLVGNALKIGFEKIGCTIDKFAFTIDFFLNQWTIPAIFFTNLLRFYIGDILYLKDLEKRSDNENITKETEAIQAILWFFTFSVFFSQFSLLSLMSIKMESPSIFYSLLTYLLLLDIVWIFVIWFFKKIKIKQVFVPKQWLLLDLFGLLFLILKDVNYWGLEYYIGYYTIGFIFIIIFFIDLYLDYFRLIRG